MSNQTSPLDWATAHRLAFELTTRLPAEIVGLSDAAGRTLAEDVLALTDVPHYASSAMDGWAVSGDAPWRLETGTGELMAGEARAIVTGGLIPCGTSGVLRSESGVLAGEIGVLHSGPGILLDRSATAAAGEPAVGQHIRLAGEEVSSGGTVIRAGTVLNPIHLAVAAIAGHDTLAVCARPRVGLILSGNEVIERGIAAPGFVRDAFGPQLPSFIALLGGVVVGHKRIGDDHAETVAAFDAETIGLTAANTDLLVSTGGTSNSSADHLRRALASVGAKIVIDGIRMRPGGPTFVAQLPDGRFVLCLPGNPLAAMMGLLTVVAPLIAACAGITPPALGSTVIGHDIDPAKPSTRLLPFLETAGRARVSEWLGSGMLRGLAEADGVLVCPPAGARAGDILQTITLPWRRAH